MFLLEAGFSKIMLLAVVKPAKAYSPAVRWLLAQSTICPMTNMSAFDRSLRTAAYAAMVASYPCAVCRTIARVGDSLPALKPLRKSRNPHWSSPPSSASVVNRWRTPPLRSAVAVPRVWPQSLLLSLCRARGVISGEHSK